MFTLENEIKRLSPWRLFGRVVAIQGMLIEVAGAQRELSIGSRLHIMSRQEDVIPCEVVGFSKEHALLMPFKMIEGVGVGCKAFVEGSVPAIHPTEEWLGRVINAMGEPIDGKGPLKQGSQAFPVRAQPPAAHLRSRVGAKIDLGVRSINTFTPCCMGQRMGIFAGSGVGKSVLLSMFAKYTNSDIAVIGLIGERGREVQEFIQDDLGEEGLARSVIIVATSDETALMRRGAAYMTMAVCEFFSSQNKDVLCLMDSVTRFAMAQREIGLAGGEPPASKGYTPTVFSELPRLLERAGPGVRMEDGVSGSVTGLFTVLVDGDDHNEPISDAVRGILDGHIVLDRSIAERGRFPAVNVLRSVSRTLPECNNKEENDLLVTARKHLSAYNDMEEMIRLGAYKAGANPEVDEAIHYYPALEEFLAQQKGEKCDLHQGFDRLLQILQNQPLIENTALVNDENIIE